MRMLLIGLVEVAEALKVAGEPTVDPFVGDVTVTPAKAAAVMAMAAIAVLINFFISLGSPGRFVCRSRCCESTEASTLAIFAVRPSCHWEGTLGVLGPGA